MTAPSIEFPCGCRIDLPFGIMRLDIARIECAHGNGMGPSPFWRDRAVESLLVDAIDQWMRASSDEMEYAHGNAQGIARALAAVRATTFGVEWEAGLDGYQNRVTTGDDNPT